MDTPNVKISVVIPAHNEGDFLPATLAALERQTFRNFEVIVVANGCTDHTAQAAQGRCDQLYQLARPSLGKARNLGGRKARGEILLFLDADTILDPRALERVACEFTREYSMGTMRGVPDSGKISHRLIYMLKNGVHRWRLHYGSSGVILCWKDQFREVGGFDEALFLRENSDLNKRLRRFGKYLYLSTAAAITSMRRYDEKGTGEMVCLWVKVWLISIFSDLRHQTYELVSNSRRTRQSGRPFFLK